eukprot:TRINITY_DN64865_c0_g1_i1.p2 TRINITY_DN64865_c0_g1~~TRINITY_DN64865_c0_g1_i1.p2  ORF type:complete len:464 (+),score=63.26 TRINITY_DN64865_c0_g1_i1:85-1392(+)
MPISPSHRTASPRLGSSPSPRSERLPGPVLSGAPQRLPHLALLERRSPGPVYAVGGRLLARPAGRLGSLPRAPRFRYASPTKARDGRPLRGARAPAPTPPPAQPAPLPAPSPAPAAAPPPAAGAPAAVASPAGATTPAAAAATAPAAAGLPAERGSSGGSERAAAGPRREVAAAMEGGADPESAAAPWTALCGSAGTTPAATPTREDRRLLPPPSGASERSGEGKAQTGAKTAAPAAAAGARPDREPPGSSASPRLLGSPPRGRPCCQALASSAGSTGVGDRWAADPFGLIPASPGPAAYSPSTVLTLRNSPGLRLRPASAPRAVICPAAPPASAGASTESASRPVTAEHSPALSLRSWGGPHDPSRPCSFGLPHPPHIRPSPLPGPGWYEPLISKDVSRSGPGFNMKGRSGRGARLFSLAVPLSAGRRPESRCE